MTHKAKELETVTIFTIPNGYSGIETTYRIVSEQSIIPVLVQVPQGALKTREWKMEE